MIGIDIAHQTVFRPHRDRCGWSFKKPAMYDRDDTLGHTISETAPIVVGAVFRLRFPETAYRYIDLAEN